MSETITAVRQPVLDDLLATLEDDANELPPGVVSLLWFNREYEPVTLTSGLNSREITLVTLGNGNFLVTTDTRERGWYVPAELAETTPIFPRVESRVVDDSPVSYEYVFDHSDMDGMTATAQPAPNPIRRCESPVEITHLTLINGGGGIPYEWMALTREDEPAYFRERSGTLKAKVGGEYGIDGDLVFHAFVGREFPGTILKIDEALRIFDAVEYINISADVAEVPEPRLKAFFDAQQTELNPDGTTSDDEIDLFNDN